MALTCRNMILIADVNHLDSIYIYNYPIKSSHISGYPWLSQNHHTTIFSVEVVQSR